MQTAWTRQKKSERMISKRQSMPLGVTYLSLQRRLFPLKVEVDSVDSPRFAGLTASCM
jgi:hypothetical protein